MTNTKTTIGRNALVDIIGSATAVPAKVDTGADSSSIWSSQIMMQRDGTLHFVLFDKTSPFYNGTMLATKEYRVAVVRSTTGHVQIRYQVKLRVKIAGRTINAVFNLSERSMNKFPVLIGRRTLREKFVVDVTKSEYDDSRVFNQMKHKYNKELATDPHKFYEKYHKDNIHQVRKQI